MVLILYFLLKVLSVVSKVNNVLKGKVVGVKHPTQIPAREVLLVKAIKMHVLFATLRLESISVRGISSYKISTTKAANLVFVLLDLTVGNY